MDPNTTQTQQARKRASRGNGKAGRPGKIGEAHEAAIIATLTVGACLNDAARSLGIDSKTIRNHRKRNPDFSRRVDQAIHDGKVKLVQKVTGDRAWQAAAWMLERRWGEQYGKREKHEHSGPKGGPIETRVGPLDLSKLSDDELETLRGLRAKAEPSVN
jgi:transposase